MCGIDLRTLVQDVERDEENRGACAAGRGSGEGHVDIVVDAGRIGHAADPFRDTRKQRKMVELLECVLVYKAARHVLYDRDDRDRCLQRLGQTGHQQGRRRPVLGGDDRDLAGDSRKRVRHGGAGIFGAVADLADAVIGRGQEQGGGNALTEDLLHAVALKGCGEQMGAGHVIGGRCRL